MTNDQFLLFPMLSYGYKNTVGAVAHLFFSDPPFAPHAIVTLITRSYELNQDLRLALPFCLLPAYSGQPLSYHSAILIQQWQRDIFLITS